MATYRVHKTKNYSVMSNHHFKEKKMSLKAKGLLSLMLSLPDDWDYSIAGLTTLSKDGKDSVMSALKELEAFGYLERKTIRNEKGHIKDYEYNIFECPKNRPLDSENPNQEKPDEEEKEQLSTNQSSTNKVSTTDKKDKEIPLIEPNIFTKELIKSGYIEENDLYIQEYNDFTQDMCDEHTFQIMRSCITYFTQRATGIDNEGNPIRNKFAYFQEAIDFGLLKISPYYVKKNIPDDKFGWLRD